MSQYNRPEYSPRNALYDPDLGLTGGDQVGHLRNALAMGDAATTRHRRKLLSDPTATALFLGEDSHGADLGKLDAAKAMAARGSDPESIWRSTGWFDQHGRWSYEIDDNPSSLKNTTDTGKRRARPMGHVLRHDELYARVPDASRVPVSIAPDVNMGAFGMYDPDGGALGGIGIEPPRMAPKGLPFRSTAWHELQHFLDRGIDFPKPPLMEEKEQWIRSASERRANNADFRNRLSPAERAHRSPFNTEDEMMRWRAPMSD